MGIYWIEVSAGETIDIIEAGAAYFDMSVPDFCAAATAASWAIVSGIQGVTDAVSAVWNYVSSVPPNSIPNVVFGWFGADPTGGGKGGGV